MALMSLLITNYNTLFFNTNRDKYFISVKGRAKNERSWLLLNFILLTNRFFYFFNKNKINKIMRMKQGMELK